VYALNVKAYPFSHIQGTGFRAIYDLANLYCSRYINATGQSQNPFSKHYSDLSESRRIRFPTTPGSASPPPPSPRGSKVV